MAYRRASSATISGVKKRQQCKYVSIAGALARHQLAWRLKIMYRNKQVSNASIIIMAAAKT